MPLYEYECDACGHRFERIQKFSDAPVETCPACGGSVHKRQSAPAFHLKGTGWYVTDYAKKDKTGEGSAASGASEKKGGADGEKAGKADTSEKTESTKSDTSGKTDAGASTSGSAPASTTSSTSTSSSQAKS